MGGIFEVKIFMVCEVEHFYLILSRDIKGKPEQILEEIQYSKNKRIFKRTPNHLGNPWHDGDMEDKKKKKKKWWRHKSKRRAAPLEAQWQRIRLPRQETRVQSSIQEDPHAAREQLSPFAATSEPVL